MKKTLSRLISAAKSGTDEAIDALVAYAVEADSAETVALLARRKNVHLRVAAVRAACARRDDESSALVSRFANDDATAVRRALARALRDHPAAPHDRLCMRLLGDADRETRFAAAEAATKRAGITPDQIDQALESKGWYLRESMAAALRFVPAEFALRRILVAAGDDDEDVATAAAMSGEHHAKELGDLLDDLALPPTSVFRAAKLGLAEAGVAKRARRFSAWVTRHADEDPDSTALAEYGTNLTLEAGRGRLPRGHDVDETVSALIEMLTAEHRRAVVLLGEPGTGKTAIVNEVVHRLAAAEDAPWHVVRVSAGDILTGTKYLGEWETRVSGLLDEVSAPRRVVLYVPAIEELSVAGSSSKSDMNVATMLAPHIESGRIALLGESSPEGYRRGLARSASQRRLYSVVQLPATSADETETLVRAVAQEHGLTLPDELVSRIIELGDFYLPGIEQPGRAVGLLRLALEQPDAVSPDSPDAESGPRAIDANELLATLSRSTGVPAEILDDRVSLDLDAVRSFFTDRVMGQPEAIDAVVELLTLIKAGLNDPDKPFGVLFFVGPTGVGKTELARALAEFLFGDPARLVRFDMSEYASYDAFERLIGKEGRPGLLTSAVRERPFSVLLLDEIEKGHGNVFDLCLQIFDAGRLTDNQGKTADFRRSILIVTSNVGAGSATAASVGFGGEAPRAAVEPETTLIELQRFFRPEFLNRLDRIVSFRPLSEETAERIARRELSRVLERGGIARRGLALDVDPAVIPLLLRKGYSRAFGARPLKRTVERLVLAPVARAIAEGRAAAGSVLRLTARDDRVAVRVVPPEPKDTEPAEAPESAAPRELQQRAAALREQATSLDETAESLRARRSALLRASSESGFWDDRPAAVRAMDEVHRLDGALSAVGRLEKSARSAADAAARLAPRSKRTSKLTARITELEARAAHLGRVLAGRNSTDLGDAFVVLTAVTSDGADLDAVGRAARMYAGFARRHGLDVDVVDDRVESEPAIDTITLLVEGLGAHALLFGEVGLHRFARTWRRGEKKGEDKTAVRVEVLAAPAQKPHRHDASGAPLETHVTKRKRAASRVSGQIAHEVRLFHRPSMTAVVGWSGGDREEALTRAQRLLAARVATAGRSPTEATGGKARRHYVLGPAPRVRDGVSGRSSGQLDRLLRGELDEWLATDSSHGS